MFIRETLDHLSAQLSGIAASLPLVDFSLAHREAKAAVVLLKQRHGLTTAPGFRKKQDGWLVRRTAARGKTGTKKNKDAGQLDLF